MKNWGLMSEWSLRLDYFKFTTISTFWWTQAYERLPRDVRPPRVFTVSFRRSVPRTTPLWQDVLRPLSLWERLRSIRARPSPASHNQTLTLTMCFSVVRYLRCFLFLYTIQVINQWYIFFKKRPQWPDNQMFSYKVCYHPSFLSYPFELFYSPVLCSIF